MTFSDSLKGVEMTETLKLYHAKDDTFKGIILNHKEEHVMGAFPHPRDYIFPMDMQKFSEDVAINNDEVYPLKVFAAVEGTLIRVYYYDEQWNISTSSRIDAYTSFWSTRQSFGAQFEEFVCSITGTPFEVFLCSLEKNKKYFFLLPTVGTNRLGKLFVENEPKCIYLVGVEDEQQKLIYGEELDKSEHNLWMYLDEYNVESLEELQEIVLNQDQNVIVYQRDKVFKCVSNAYKSRCDLRNNEPNIIYRYIELLKAQSERLDEFKDMYPEVNFVGYVDKRLFLMSKYIHSSYIARYIKKEYVLLPKIYFHIMKKCHQNFLENRERTTIERVQEMIMNQEPKVILSLIRNFSIKE